MAQNKPACLRLFMDVKKIAVSEKQLRMLGSDHGEIKHGIYYYSDPQKPTKTREKVQYWTKDPAFEVVQLLQDNISGHSIDPKTIISINIVFGGDHGKKNFAFAPSYLFTWTMETVTPKSLDWRMLNAVKTTRKSLTTHVCLK